MQHIPKQWHYKRRPGECQLAKYYCTSGWPNFSWCVAAIWALFYYEIYFMRGLIFLLC